MTDATPGGAALVSKGEYARLKNVTPGRVSQWISEGKLTSDAFDGEGRRARVRVAVADAQLRRSLDIGQMTGNGLETRLGSEPVAFAPRPEGPAAAPIQLPTPGSGIEDRIKSEKLREIEFRNRDAAEKELARRGYYTRTDDMRVALGQVASGMLNVFEGALGDLATAIAAQFEVPQRDVLHLLRSEFRQVRERAAASAKRAADEMPGLTVDVVDEQSEAA